MNLYDRTEGDASPDELVRLFIDESTRRLTSLAVVPRLRCSTGILHWGDNGWEDGTSVLITNWFDVTVSFTSEAIEGAFRFGERESAIWAVARKVGTEHSFALWEWGAALGRVAARFEGGEWVHQPDRVRMIVDSLADGLQDMHDGIANASATQLNRLLAAREARAEEDAERNRRRDQDRDEVQAAAAFRRGDFHTAVKLLRAHEAHLSVAQRRKLEMAEGKLREGSR